LEDKLENYSLVTYTLFSLESGQTVLTWTQKGFATEQGYEHSKKGIAEFMTSIKAVVER
jgi:hypothetical protein